MAVCVFASLIAANAHDARAERSGKKCYVSRFGDYICDGGALPERPGRDKPPVRPQPPVRPKPDPHGYVVPVPDICELKPEYCTPVVPPPGKTCTPPTSCSQSVSSSAALQSAMNGAKCGCEVVASGNFSGNFTLNAKCSVANPVVVRSGGRATFGGGKFTITGAGGIVAGMAFNGTVVQVSGDGNRVSGNAFKNPQGDAIKVNGNNNRVDYNEIAGAPANGIEINLRGGAARNRNNRIDHNYIHDSRASGNGGESIRILTDKTGMAGAIIEYNLMERVSVPGEGEAISIKTGGNLIRGNTLRNSPKMGIVNRNGNNNTYEANFISGAGGLRLHSDNNRAIGNIVDGGDIRVMGGNRYQTMPEEACIPGSKPSTKLGKCTHSVARSSVLENNRASVVVGYTFDPSHTGAMNTKVSNNCGTITRRQESGTTISGGPCAPTARDLQVNETGPAGLENECPSAED